jgi:hypothetical protein
MPVLEALTRLCRESGGVRVVELLHKFAPSWLAQMPSVLSEADRERVRNSAEAVTQHRMLREMGEALDAFTAETPLLMVLEDLHWSDFSTLELISAIARRTEPARLMILATYRSVEMLTSDHPLRIMKEELGLHRYCEELRLKLLTVVDVAEYLARRFPKHGPRQFNQIAPVVHERTEGNPLFMVNVADFLAGAAGVIAGSAEQPIETFSIRGFDTPHSIRQMIQRNLERLNSDEQSVLEAAAVAGADFSAASVAAALERPQNEVEACCALLSRREQFIRAQGSIQWPDGTIAGRYNFLHTLYLDVLYERAAPGQRSESHHRIAEREESAYGERSDEIATELANHYSRAKDKNKAVQYFRLAGERAVARGAVVEAEAHYRHALKLLATWPQAIERDSSELALQLGLGRVLRSLKSWSHPDVGRAYARAQELVEKLGESSQTVAVLQGLVLSALGLGQFKLSRQLAERMLMAAERAGDRAALCAAHTDLGETLLWCAEYLDAQKHLELAMSYYDEADIGELTLAPAIAAIVVLLLGFPDRARQLMSEVLRGLRGRDDSYLEGIVHVYGGIMGGLLRDRQVCVEYAQALRLFGAKQPVFTGLADVITGRAFMFQGSWHEAVDYLRKGIAFHEAVGLINQLMFAKLDEAEYFASQGQVDNGLALIADAIVDSAELAHIRSPAFRQRADLLAQSNSDSSAIEDAYCAAIECGRSQSARYHELQATTAFARWLKSRNRTVEAHTMLAAIYGWFSEGFDTFALREAKAVLNELTNTDDTIRSTQRT